MMNLLFLEIWFAIVCTFSVHYTNTSISSSALHGEYHQQKDIIINQLASMMLWAIHNNLVLYKQQGNHLKNHIEF